MNKDFGNMEELEYGVRLTMPLLTQEEINGIYININEITEQFTKMAIKDKDLAIAQYIMDKQQKMLEQKQFILDKVTDELKEDIEKAKEQIKHYERQYKTAKEKEDKFHIKSFHRQINRWQSRFETLREILNIIEGGKK